MLLGTCQEGFVMSVFSFSHLTFMLISQEINDNSCNAHYCDDFVYFTGKRYGSLKINKLIHGVDIATTYCMLIYLHK
jgi:glutamine cyclotransferase